MSEKMEKSNIVQVPMSLVYITQDKFHPLWEEVQKPSQSFIEDYGMRGQLQNITLVADGQGRYIVAAGRKRYQAAVQLGHETINAEIIKAESDIELRSIKIRENAHRRERSYVYFGRELKQLWDAQEKEHLEQFASAEEITPLSEKDKMDLATSIFGVSKRTIADYRVLGYDTSPKVLKAAEKGTISNQVAIVIGSRHPGNFKKQEELLVKQLSKGQGKVKKENFDPIGQRPVKAKELLELAQDSAYIPSKTTTNVKQFALFLSGKMQESEREDFFHKNPWAEEWTSGSGGEDEGAGETAGVGETDIEGDE